MCRPQRPAVVTRRAPLPRPLLTLTPEPPERFLPLDRDDRALEAGDAEHALSRGRDDGVRRLVHACRAGDDVRRHRVRWRKLQRRVAVLCGSVMFLRERGVALGRGGHDEVEVAPVAPRGGEDGRVGVVHDEGLAVAELAEAHNLRGDECAVPVDRVVVRFGGRWEGVEVGIQQCCGVIGLGREDNVCESGVDCVVSAVDIDRRLLIRNGDIRVVHVVNQGDNGCSKMDV